MGCKILRHRTDGFTFPPKEVVLRIFIAIKNSLSSAGFEPANHRSSGKHVTIIPPRATILEATTSTLWRQTHGRSGKCELTDETHSWLAECTAHSHSNRTQTRRMRGTATRRVMMTSYLTGKLLEQQTEKVISRKMYLHKLHTFLFLLCLLLFLAMVLPSHLWTRKWFCHRRLGRVVNAPASCSGPVFKPCPRDRLYFLWVFPNHPD
jgi:hypothetical protein